MKLRTLNNLDFKGKTVLLRCDLNVPLNNKGEVSDITKIKRHKITIDELIDKKAKILIISHLGRPKGKEVEELSLNKISDEFVKVMNIKEITVLPFCRPNIIKSVLKEKKEGSITFMENIRFYPEEEENNQNFAKELAAIGDYFINDAFSVSHRKHLSTFSLSKFLPSYLGRSLELELTMLNKINENIDRPVMAIIGGSKISTKINLLSNLVKKVDFLVIGGAMANTFLIEKELNIGNSLVEKDKIDVVKNVLQKAKENNCTVILPKEVVVSKSLNGIENVKNINISEMDNDLAIYDIGEKTIEEICNTAVTCKTIFWNGPLGVYEVPPFDNSTNVIGRTIAILTKGNIVTSVVGGGDTVAALNNAELTGGFSYVSIAGGALVEWLEGKKLPGLQFLENL
ncbi:MAG: phosphoglycerate kinase [Pelagibacterales bacterium]|nr:phosphoglycerate kinase [Pelagibacterales bacterium]OUU61409.1 MAG: phosphoglycerate kinase [Alphaproteobacteria bacterium TMED62]